MFEQAFGSFCIEKTQVISKLNTKKITSKLVSYVSRTTSGIRNVWKLL